MPDEFAKCTKCGTLVPTSNDSSQREPCPKCGSLSRKLDADASDAVEIALHDQSRLRRKDQTRPSDDKIRQEIIGGYDLHRDTGKWNLKDRVIDRDNDYYFEHVVDPATGETIHKCEESLKDHFGHGSAKKKADDT